MKFTYFIPIVFLVFTFGCNEGIAPKPIETQPGFGGRITFSGEWPADVTRTHIVMFKDPLNDASDFNILNIRYISNEIPYNSQYFDYTSEDNYLDGGLQPGDYAYLAVAQSKSTSLSLNREDWYVVGVFSADTTQQPAILTLPSGTFVQNINITCDFNNPPPQPPGGN